MNSKIDKAIDFTAFKEHTMKVLLLDQYWQPVAVISWQKAMSLVLTTQKLKAQVIQEYEDKIIHTVSKSFNIPSVVRVFGSCHRRTTIPLSYDNIFYRDQYTCAYCGVKCIKKHLTIDHIFPVVQGGQRSWKNLITACRECNQKKGGRTPKQANMPLLFRPKEPSWSLAFHLKLSKSDPVSDWSQFLYGLDQNALPYESDLDVVVENG
jgi:5-methylcytosine-specific restriction endonuclease McrA